MINKHKPVPQEDLICLENDNAASMRAKAKKGQLRTKACTTVTRMPGPLPRLSPFTLTKKEIKVLRKTLSARVTPPDQSDQGEIIDAQASTAVTATATAPATASATATVGHARHIRKVKFNFAGSRQSIEV